MKTLLRIDCSLRKLNSYSRMAGDYFVKNWQSRYPHHRIIHRDLEREPVPHLTQQMLEAFIGVGGEISGLSDELIEELIRSDEVLITCPMYNFGIPSSLKAYFDHIIRSNKTFRYHNEPKGMLNNKTAYLITATGGSKSDAIQSMETQLTNALSFIGITNLKVFHLSNTANPENAHSALLSIYKEINNQFNTHEQII